MYFAQNAVTGDGSGGNMTVIFEFKGEGEPVSGRFFNLEQWSAHRSGVVTSGGSMQATNFETLGPVGLVNRNWRFEIESNGAGVSPPRQQDSRIPIPLFLGSVAPIASLAASLDFAIPNTTATSWVVTIQGYIWEPRSVQAEGGLRRPVDSLYGR